MTTNRVFNRKNNNILYTVTSIILLCSIFAVMMFEIFTREEKNCYETLRVQTEIFKDDIEEQIRYDRETLALVANLASELYEKNADFSLVFDSYKTTGLISNVGILQPDNTFVTQKGILDFNGMLSFSEEAARGEYISGRVTDVTNKELEIIRIAQPIISNEKIVGILYGSINLDDLKKRYEKKFSELDSQLFIYEKRNGNFILDTIDDNLGNIESLKNRKYEKGYSYEKLISGKTGYSVFTSLVWNEKLYLLYTSLDIADWKIMLAQKETHVFENARYILWIMCLTFVLVFIVLVLYFLYLLKQESRKKYITAESSQIRKLLLDINNRNNNITETLKRLSLFSKARSAIFVDTDEDAYHYISPAYEEKLLNDKDRKYFICELLGYAAELRISRQKSVDVISIKTNSALESSNAKFYEFLVNHDINEIVFASVTNRNNHISVLGVVNPKKVGYARELLSDVAVCFSIAIYNKKHLNRTKIAATTDSLTGLLNYTAYKKDIKRFNKEQPENFACVYADVNDLHLRNNRYGHAAGDEMLIYIANTLKEVFYGQRIYRTGGDEFLVLIKDTDVSLVKDAINQMEERLLPLNYYVATGMAFTEKNTDTEELITVAEKRMYDAKARHYQNKDSKSLSLSKIQEYKVLKTGNDDVDALLNAMKHHFYGIYNVSLKTDEAHSILMPSYLGYKERESSFSKLFAKYIEENVNPDFHRALLSFLNNKALSSQFAEGNIPKIAYKKTNGENAILSVYHLAEDNESDYTLWVFERIENI